jgi:hypothetical protein
MDHLKLGCTREIILLTDDETIIYVSVELFYDANNERSVKWQQQTPSSKLSSFTKRFINITDTVYRFKAVAVTTVLMLIILVISFNKNKIKLQKCQTKSISKLKN